MFGNGDIWEAYDALRMMRTTGCDGVVVGRGCLGRPWLFRELSDVFAGKEPVDPPSLGEVADVMLEHATLLSKWLPEAVAVRMFRKHATWYTKGFRYSTRLRGELIAIETLDDLRRVLRAIDRDEPFPHAALRVPRGKRAGTQKVALPEGYLDDLDDATAPGAEAEDSAGGG